MNNVRTSNTFRGFLKEIVARPEDDVPRLILADWLEENAEDEDDVLLWQLIREQFSAPAFCPFTDSRFRDWANRQAAWFPVVFGKKELLQPNPVAGFSPLRYNHMGEAFVSVEYDRGFVGAIHCTEKDWLEVGPAVVQMAPVTRVCLAGVLGSTVFIRYEEFRTYVIDADDQFREHMQMDDNQEEPSAVYESDGDACSEDLEALLDCYARAVATWARKAPQTASLFATEPYNFFRARRIVRERMGLYSDPAKPSRQKLR